MAYTPTEWATGDVITAAKLNNMEQGIEDAFVAPAVTIADEGEVLTVNSSGEWVNVALKHIVDIVVDGSLSPESIDTEYKFTGEDLTITGDTVGLHDDPEHTEIVVHFSTRTFYLRYSYKSGSNDYKFSGVYTQNSQSGSALSTGYIISCAYDKADDEIDYVLYTSPSVMCSGLEGKWTLLNNGVGHGKWEGYCDAHTGTLQVAADFSSANLVTDYVPRHTTGAGLWPIDERFEVTFTIGGVEAGILQLKSSNEVGSMYSGITYNPLTSAWILAWINYANDAWTAAIKVIS